MLRAVDQQLSALHPHSLNPRVLHFRFESADFNSPPRNNQIQTSALRAMAASAASAILPRPEGRGLSRT